MLVYVSLDTDPSPPFNIPQMGYGSRALKALNAYYSGEIMNVDEETRAEPEYPFPGKVGRVRFAMFRGVPVFLTIGGSQRICSRTNLPSVRHRRCRHYY